MNAEKINMENVRNVITMTTAIIGLATALVTLQLSRRKTDRFKSATQASNASTLTESAIPGQLAKGFACELLRVSPTLVLSAAAPLWLLREGAPVTQGSVLFVVGNGVVFSAGISTMLVGMMQRWLRGDFHRAR